MERLLGLLFLLPVAVFLYFAFWRGLPLRKGARGPDDYDAWGGTTYGGPDDYSGRGGTSHGAGSGHDGHGS